jgi:hypothetical protein
VSEVDTSARYYQWFTTEEHEQRIAGFEWWPTDKIETLMSQGRLVFIHRDQPGDTWGPPTTVAEDVPWTVAQKMAEGQGFTVEVAVSDG